MLKQFYYRAKRQVSDFGITVQLTVAEVLVHDTALMDNDREWVENYLKAKYGI
ncbi:MAG TPA: hypothetical protein PK733_02885 [Clostridiales bacterium]|nr:hypothetical protein [Clostridiales bacterium]